MIVSRYDNFTIVDRLQDTSQYLSEENKIPLKWQTAGIVFLEFILLIEMRI